MRGLVALEGLYLWVGDYFGIPAVASIVLVVVGAVAVLGVFAVFVIAVCCMGKDKTD